MLSNSKKFNLSILGLLLLQSGWVIILIFIISLRQDGGLLVTVNDIVLYYNHIHSVLIGATPFHSMLLEYPIGAFLIMALPAFFASTFNHFFVMFVLEIIAWNAISYLMVVRWVKRERGNQSARQSAVWFTIWMMIFTPMWGLRVDVPAATLIFASFTWLISRPGLAAVIGVVGGYIKLVPLVMVPIAIRQRRGYKVPLVAAGTFLVILAVWWVTARVNLDYAIHYHFQRGIEIGSLYSGLLYTVGQIAHWSMYTASRFASSELVTPVPSDFLKLIPIIQVLAVLYPLGRLKTGTHTLNLRLVIAMVLGYIIFGKVLSPQYLLWLIPLYAVISGPQARKQQILFSLACICTTIIYPIGFKKLIELHPLMFVALNVRNGLLVWLYWIAVRRHHITEPA